MAPLVDRVFGAARLDLLSTGCWDQRFRVSRIWDSGFRVKGIGFKGLGFRGFRVQGLGFRLQG